MKELLIKGENVTKTFGEVHVLNHINIEIYAGDFTVIMGSSGAGKSTLLYALSGMDELTEGIVFYKDNKISQWNEREKAKLRAEEFGFVFQQPHLVSNLTLFENVAVSGFLGGRASIEGINNQARELLKQMHVKDAENRLPSQVSGGEAQRAAIARAIIHRPGILFADEPTGALNKKNTQEVLNLLTSFHEQGQSILMVTHDVKGALRANRILYMEDGRIVGEQVLPAYSQNKQQERELQITEWLAGLGW